MQPACQEVHAVSMPGGSCSQHVRRSMQSACQEVCHVLVGLCSSHGPVLMRLVVVALCSCGYSWPAARVHSHGLMR